MMSEFDAVAATINGQVDELVDGLQAQIDYSWDEYKDARKSVFVTILVAILDVIRGIADQTNLKEIMISVKTISDMTTQIAATAEEQSSVALLKR